MTSKSETKISKKNDIEKSELKKTCRISTFRVILSLKPIESHYKPLKQKRQHEEKYD